MGPAVVTVCSTCELAIATRAVVFVAVGAVIFLVGVCASSCEACVELKGVNELAEREGGRLAK